MRLADAGVLVNLVHDDLSLSLNYSPSPLFSICCCALEMVKVPYSIARSGGQRSLILNRVSKPPDSPVDVPFSRQNHILSVSFLASLTSTFIPERKFMASVSLYHLSLISTNATIHSCAWGVPECRGILPVPRNSYFTSGVSF